MGNEVSSMSSSRVAKKKNKRAKHRRGMFTYPNGRNIREDHTLAGANQWVTVFFDWTDRKVNDEELMDLVVARIDARDGIISSQPVHHDVKFCLSLRVPKIWHRTDVSIAAGAKLVAQWHKSEIRHAGMRINRRYLFRAANRKTSCQ
jgi:hypothetical protein